MRSACCAWGAIFVRDEAGIHTTVRSSMQGVVSGWLGAARKAQPPDAGLTMALSWAYTMVVETTGLEPAAPLLAKSHGLSGLLTCVFGGREGAVRAI